MKNIIKDVSVFAAFAVCGVLLITLRNSISEGIKNGLSISAEILIPSLFPFLVFSILASQTAFSGRIAVVSGFIMNKIFHLPGKCFSAMLFGFIGGYPVGARLCGELYEKDSLSEKDCLHIMSFCVNAGPSFVVTAVGEGMMGSRKAGIVLLVALSLSSLVTGVVTGIFKEKTVYDKNIASEKKDFSEALIYSVSSAIQSIFSICAWVILFSAFLSVVNILHISETIKLIVASLTEVTTGVRPAAKLGGLPFVAACLSSGGISILFQLLPIIKKCGVKVKTYLFFRIVNSVLSYIFTKLILCFVDISAEVFSYTAEFFSFNAPASASLLVMCALFIFQLRREAYLQSDINMKFSR